MISVPVNLGKKLSRKLSVDRVTARTTMLASTSIQHEMEIVFSLLFIVFVVLVVIIIILD